MASPSNSIGITEECVILQLCGLGDCQTGLPDSKLTASKSACFPPGARMTFAPWIKGHCPEYQGGTVAPNSCTRSMVQRNSPVSASAQVTWHFGPNATTKFSVSAGTVRDIPWLRLMETG